MFVSVQVVVSLGKPLVPWTIIEIQSEQSFCELFTVLQAGFFDCVNVTGALKKATLLRTYVGKVEQLMITSSSQSVLNICSQFGIYIKFLVEVASEGESSTVISNSPQCF